MFWQKLYVWYGPTNACMILLEIRQEILNIFQLQLYKSIFLFTNIFIHTDTS